MLMGNCCGKNIRQQDFQYISFV